MLPAAAVLPESSHSPGAMYLPAHRPRGDHLYAHLASERRLGIAPPLVVPETNRNQGKSDSQTFSGSGTVHALAKEITTPVVYYSSDVIKAILIILGLDIKALYRELGFRD